MITSRGEIRTVSELFGECMPRIYKKDKSL